MTYRVGIAETLHITGDVPVEGQTIDDDRGPSFQTVHLGEYGVQRFDLIFSGPLADQFATLTHLAAACMDAASRVHDLRVAAGVKSHEETHSPDCGCLDAIELLDTPMGLEDDKAGEE